MKRTAALFLSVVMLIGMLAGCGAESNLGPLPAPAPIPEDPFGIDQNINMETIDDYLGREDVAYRDVRMLFDPADYGAIGGEADLTRTIAGFKITPYPYIATLSALPVDGAYTGHTLYDLAWNEDGSIASATPNYEESSMILEELFPKDKAIFLMCGGGGYAGMMKSLLVFLGWDETMLYNVGANWGYTGENSLELAIYPEDANEGKIYTTWRADYAYIDFEKLHPAG